jgi:putative ABC transport system permease protein
MRLLTLISWPYFRTHIARTGLTVVGITLGVAAFVAMHTANQAVQNGFTATIDRIAGKTQLQVSAGETGFDEEVLDRVQSAATVRVAVPVVEAVVDTNIKDQGSLLVLGIDMTGDRSLRDYDLDKGDDVVDDPLVFLAQPDSLIVSAGFAAKNHLATGGRLVLGTVQGQKTFVVRGIMNTSGLASAFGGSIAVMDVYAAQRMFGRGRTFDRLDIGIKQGVALEDCQRELQKLLGPGFEIQPPTARGQQFESTLTSYSIMATISSAFAMFIGMFIIYNSFAIAVTQRRAEIGILRALGTTRHEIRRLFLCESATLGFVGSLAGSVLGLLIARAIAASIGSLIADVYGVAQHADSVVPDFRVLGLALVIGTATSLVGGTLPAWSAARVDPIQALQKGKTFAVSAQENRIRLALAATLALVTILCLVAGTSRVWFYLAYVLTVANALLLSPLLSQRLAQAIRPVLQRLRPVEGVLAVDSLIQAPKRTAASLLALTLSLALVVGFSGMSRASYDSIIDWMKTTLNPDLLVLPSPDIVTRTVRFPSEMAPEIARVPGVQRVQMLRNGRVTFRQTPIMVIALEVDAIDRKAGRGPTEGDADEMYRKAAAGEGLIVSDNLAELQHLTLGQVIELAAPFGQLRLPIVGIVVDYSDQRGSILMDRSLFIKYWHDDSVNSFRVYLKPGATAIDVRQRIIERYAGQRQVFVLTNDELKQHILKIADQWFGLTTVQIVVAILVAILGIVNTLTVSVIDRRRELGVLQAVGGLRRQVRYTIWIEALAIVSIGMVLGFALGAINLYYVLQIVHRDIAGMRLDYVFPFGTALMLVPTMLTAALLAAIWPAETAVRGRLVEALEYE